MPSLLDELTAAFSAAFQNAGFDPKFGAVQVSARPDLCQFQCNGAMPAAKSKGQNPRLVGQSIVDALSADSRFAALGLAGPGFINISLKDETLRDAILRLSVPQAHPKQKILVDFGGPNVAKPMHVGHLRSSVIGDCLQRLHRALGQEVLSDIHMGDWGTQMGMLILGLQEEGKEADFSLADLERIYPKMSAACKEDPKKAEAARLATKELQDGRQEYRLLWRRFVDLTVATLKKDFGGLGIHFDLWLGESDSQALIPAMLEDLKSRGVSQISQGAVVIPCDPEGDTEMPPLLLVKSDGGYLYGTTDLATLRERVQVQGMQRVLYVADQRQGLHFRQVFQGARKAAYLGESKAEHVGFGTVNGKDGKPFKTRDGGAMRLEGMLQLALDEAGKRIVENEIAKDLGAEEQEVIVKKIAYAAVKFADLSNHRSSDYIFDIEKFTQFEGKTGPYLLYAAVRMKSILRKAAELGQTSGDLLPPADSERRLYLKLLEMPEQLLRAAAESLPHVLCEYAYELCGSFSAFYQFSSIIHEQDAAKRGSWLRLTQMCLERLLLILEILGLEAPERM